MKQLIVLFATITLGVFIYGLIAGDNDESVVNVLADMWQSGLQARSLYGK